MARIIAPTTTLSNTKLTKAIVLTYIAPPRDPDTLTVRFRDDRSSFELRRLESRVGFAPHILQFIITGASSLTTQVWPHPFVLI
jgi:hypothetical protein